MARDLQEESSIASVTNLVSTTSGLVDPEVSLADVRLRIGGPFAWYLRLVKKRAITIGRNIWFRDEAARADTALVIHELVHVGQYARMGTPRFLATYFRDLAKAWFHYSHNLPLEAPAYERQAKANELLGRQ